MKLAESFDDLRHSLLGIESEVPMQARLMTPSYRFRSNYLVNQGALVAKVWEDVVGRTVRDSNLFNSNLFDKFERNYTTASIDELDTLDVNRVDVFDRGDVYALFDRDDPKGVPGVAAKVNLLAKARQKLLNQNRRLLEDGRR